MNKGSFIGGNIIMIELEIYECFVDIYMYILKYVGDFVLVLIWLYKIMFEVYMVMWMIVISEELLMLVKIVKE